VSPTAALRPARAGGQAQPGVAAQPEGSHAVAVVELEDLRTRVEAELASFLDGRSALLHALSPDLAGLADAARDAVLGGGKRLRAAFCYWGLRAAGGESGVPAAVRAPAALELLQASALVHDDLMDRSDTRRGAPSAHRRFADAHARAGWSGDPARFGGSAALLLGDLLLSWSDELFSAACAPAPVPAPARALFDLMRTEVIAGQFLETVEAAAPADRARLVARYKSASYTVQRPLQLGAALAGAEPALLEALGGYALPLGEAFQLRDDVRDAAEDLREGRPTLLTTLGGTPADPGDLLDRAEARIGALRESALTALAAAPLRDDSVRPVLHALAAAATAPRV